MRVHVCEFHTFVGQMAVEEFVSPMVASVPAQSCSIELYIEDVFHPGGVELAWGAGAGMMKMLFVRPNTTCDHGRSLTVFLQALGRTTNIFCTENANKLTTCTYQTSYRY